MIARRYRLAAALLGLAASGCAANAPSGTAASGAPAAAPLVVVREDLSPRYIEFIGPKILFAKPFLGVADTNYFALRSWLEKASGSVTHQLYVSESYAGPRHAWRAAHYERGDALPVVTVGSDEIACNPSCSYADDFAAALPDPLLRGSLGGLAVTFSGAGGAVERIAVPGRLVKVQLATVDAWRRRLPALKTANTASKAPDRPLSSR